MASPARELTTAQLAAKLGVDQSTPYRWTKRRRPCPHDRIGTALRFNLGEVAAWMATEGVTGQRSRRIADPEAAYWQLEKIREYVRKIQLENDATAARLISAEAERLADAAKRAAVEAALLDIAAQTPSAMKGMSLAEQREYLTDRFRRMCEHFASDEAA